MKRSTYYTYISSSQGVKLKTIRFFILFDKRECARRLNAGYTSIEVTFRNIKYQTGGTIGALEEEKPRIEGETKIVLLKYKYGEYKYQKYRDQSYKY